MKKLLVIAKSLGGGGSEVALIEFLNHLDLKKYDVTVLLMDKDDEYKNRLTRKIKVRYIRFDNKIYHDMASMYALPGKIIKKVKLNHYFHIYNLIAKHSKMPDLPLYDIAIDFYGYGAFTTAFLALNIKAKKKAFWLHDVKMSWIKNVDIYFDKFDKIYGVSKTAKNNFDNFYPKFAGKTETFLNVVDTESIVKKSLDYYPKEFKDNNFYIVTVGRLTEQKGCDIAIKAAYLLKEKILHFKWIIIGEGRDHRKLNKLIEKYKLQDNIYLLGRKSNPYPYIRNCNIYVQPSRHEGYGLSVLEARILKRPIVVSNLPVFAEQIENEKNGIICELTPQKLSEGIYKLYKNKKMLSNIVDNVSNEKIAFDSEMQKLNQL